jgi:hypothetical protein
MPRPADENVVCKSFYTMNSEILGHWQIQESLLQSYRSLFLTSQSIIFAIGSIVAADDKMKVVFLPMLILGIVLLYFWHDLGTLRGLDVSYFQMQLMKAENGKSVGNLMLEFKVWQGLGKKEKRDRLKEFGLHRSKTRLWLEDLVPLLFLVLWICLAGIVFFAWFS